MCCYKLVTCEFKWWGLQGQVESRIQKVWWNSFSWEYRKRASRKRGEDRRRRVQARKAELDLSLKLHVHMQGFIGKSPGYHPPIMLAPILQSGFIKEFKIPKLLGEKRTGPPSPSQLALFQALPSSVCIQYGSGRATNNGEGLGTLITWRGHKADAKGGGGRGGGGGAQLQICAQ